MNGVYIEEQLKSYVQTYGDKTFYSVASFFGLGISYVGNSYGEEMIKKIAEINKTPKRCPLPSKIQKQDLALWQEIIDKTQFLDEAFAGGDIKPKTGRILMMHRIYCVVNDIREIPKCGQCPKLLKNFFVGTSTAVHCEFCSRKCTHNSDKVKSKKVKSFLGRSDEEKAKTKAKFEKTCKEKFGEACFMKSQYFKDKQHEFIIENGGECNVSQIKWVRDKVDETNIEKFGNRCNLANEDQKALKIQTYLDHYGVTHPFMSKEIVDKFMTEYKAKTGYSNPASNPIVQKTAAITRAKSHIPFITSNDYFTPLFDPYQHLSDLQLGRSQLWWKCNTCGHVFAASIHSFSKSNKMTVCPFCLAKSKTINHSKDEKLIAQFLRFAFPNLKIYNMSKENRKIIPPKEIDIWMPELNIGIEYDGVYWHSVDTNDTTIEKNTILEKTKLCEEKGIHLIHIYSDEWEKDPASICQMLVDIITGTLPIDVTQHQFLMIPRDKYPPFYKIPNFHFLFCTSATIQNRDGYFVYDCGSMTFVRDDVKLNPPSDIEEQLSIMGVSTKY